MSGERKLNEKWLKAAVIGSSWGAFEIILGSFFHNMHFPMSGTMLSFFSVMLLVSFSRLWPERGLFWRAGMIAALMKSISPSAVILGPMTGIMLEALLMEGSTLLLGRTLPGYIAGGALAISSALIHKIITLLILYGFDLVKLTVFLYQYTLKVLGLKESRVDPLWLLLIVVLLYFLAGTLAAVTGYLVGNKAPRHTKEKIVLSGEQPVGFSFSEEKEYSLLWLVLHLFSFSVLLWMISRYPLWFSSLFVLIYVAVCLARYSRAIRHLKKPWFWIQVVGITLLASLVWKGIETGNYLSREGLVTGLRMNLRAVMVMVSFSAISMEFRNPVVRILLFRRGFANLYLATELAFSSFPHVMDSFPGARELFRQPVHVLTAALAHAGDLYAGFAAKEEQQPPIFLVTGGVGEGKTSFLRELATALQQRKIRTAGFLAEGIMEKGEKKGYRLVDLASGEARPFGEARKKHGRIHTGRFTFNRDTVRWGEDLLWKAVSEGRDHTVIILDEVGPLELKGKGWARALDHLLRDSITPQVWSVRNRSLRSVTLAWNFTPARIVEVGENTPGDLAALLQKTLEQKKDPSSGE